MSNKRNNFPNDSPGYKQATSKQENSEWPKDSFTHFNVNNPSASVQKVTVWKNTSDSPKQNSMPKMYKVTEENVQLNTVNLWTDPTKYKIEKKIGKNCGFCQRNGEKSDIFSSHSLRNDKGFVICPILRDYVCPICKATGDMAHTITYCPVTRTRNSGKTPISPTIMLKTSKYKSNGQQRY